MSSAIEPSPLSKNMPLRMAGKNKAVSRNPDDADLRRAEMLERAMGELQENMFALAKERDALRRGERGSRSVQDQLLTSLLRENNQGNNSASGSESWSISVGAGREWTEIKKELEELKCIENTQRDEIEEQEGAALAFLAHELAIAIARNHLFEKYMNRIKIENESLQHSLNDKVALMETELEMKDREIQCLNLEIESMKVDDSNREGFNVNSNPNDLAKIESLENSISMIAKQKTELVSKINLLQIKADLLGSSKKDAEVKVEQLKKKIHSEKSERAVYQKQVAELVEHVHTMEIRTGKGTHSVKDFESAVRFLVIEMRSAKDLSAKSSERVEFLEHELELKKVEIAKLQSQNDYLQSDIERLSNELGTISAGRNSDGTVSTGGAELTALQSIVKALKLENKVLLESKKKFEDKIKSMEEKETKEQEVLAPAFSFSNSGTGSGLGPSLSLSRHTKIKSFTYAPVPRADSFLSDKNPTSPTLSTPTGSFSGVTPLKRNPRSPSGKDAHSSGTPNAPINEVTGKDSSSTPSVMTPVSIGRASRHGSGSFASLVTHLKRNKAENNSIVNSPRTSVLTEGFKKNEKASGFFDFI